MKAFHPDYGMDHATRVRAVALALTHGIAAAAANANVTPGTVYNWRKRVTVAEVMKATGRGKTLTPRAIAAE